MASNDFLGTDFLNPDFDTDVTPSGTAAIDIAVAFSATGNAFNPSGQAAIDAAVAFSATGSLSSLSGQAGIDTALAVSAAGNVFNPSGQAAVGAAVAFSAAGNAGFTGQASIGVSIGILATSKLARFLEGGHFVLEIEGAGRLVI